MGREIEVFKSMFDWFIQRILSSISNAINALASHLRSMFGHKWKKKDFNAKLSHKLSGSFAVQWLCIAAAYAIKVAFL